MHESSIAIAQRLKAFRIKFLIAMPQIASAIGIPKDMLYKLEREENPGDITIHTRLGVYLDNMELKARNATTCWVPMTNDEEPTADLNGDMAPGSIRVVNEKPQLLLYRVEAITGNADGLIEVTNDSMEPTYKKGSLVAISRIKNSQSPVWGDCHYIIDKKWRGFVKRLYPGLSSDHIQLVSDHPGQAKHPPFELSLDNIEAIFMITAEIRR